MLDWVDCICDIKPFVSSALLTWAQSVHTERPQLSRHSSSYYPSPSCFSPSADALVFVYSSDKIKAAGNLPVSVLCVPLPVNDARIICVFP